MVYECPRTKEEALKENSRYYFTGKECRNGHVDIRYTNTGICYECKRKQMSRDYSNNKDRVKKVNHKSYLKHREKKIKKSLEWHHKNIEKSRQIKNNYKIRNREKYLESNREYARRKRQDPFYRLSHAMSKAIWVWLKGDKNYRHWENFVGFTIEQLKERLQSLFTPEMTWENYGSYWEVDHIKPQSLCENFGEAWKLDNLQPLSCAVNRSKGNRYIGEFNENFHYDQKNFHINDI